MMRVGLPLLDHHILFLSSITQPLDKALSTHQFRHHYEGGHT